MDGWKTQLFRGARIAEQIGGTAIACDVTDAGSVEALVAGAIQTMGHIDLFFANAGVGAGGGIGQPGARTGNNWVLPPNTLRDTRETSGGKAETLRATGTGGWVVPRSERCSGR